MFRYPSSKQEGSDEIRIVVPMLCGIVLRKSNAQ